MFRSPRLRLLPVWVLVSGLVALAPPTRAASPDSLFRDGVKAADRDDWLTVERAMRRALEIDPEESERKVSITGMRYEQYLPHYFLGLALYRMGRHEAADRAWRESSDQGVIRDWRDVERFERQWRELRATLGRSASRSASRSTRRTPEPAGFEEAETPRSTSRPTEPRSLERLVADLRALVDTAREKNEIPPDVESLLTRIEIELARNAPDRRALERHEAALRSHLRPDF